MFCTPYRKKVLSWAAVVVLAFLFVALGIGILHSFFLVWGVDAHRNKFL